MEASRKVKSQWQSRPTLEGAGVRLKRAFGFNEDPSLLDPFLLLDDFRSNHPADYIKGFPWHPHRGIETITYMLDGSVAHGDSMGNAGEIGPGDVQWMTAGSGIIHQEMPRGNTDGRMGGFQLWANLPASAKMMLPRYQEIKAPQIPRVVLADGVTLRVICGRAGDRPGPVRDIVIDPEYLDVSMPRDTVFRHATRRGHTVIAYIIEGRLKPEPGGQQWAEAETLVLFEDGDTLTLTTEVSPARFLLISGRPIREPIAWRGPIVMNTQEELQTAFEEYRNGTFIKTAAR